MLHHFLCAKWCLLNPQSPDLMLHLQPCGRVLTSTVQGLVCPFHQAGPGHTATSSRCNLVPLQVSIDIIKFEDLVWGRFLGRGAEGPVHACMYLDTPVAVKQTSSSTELEMNLSTGGPGSAWLEWEGSAGRCKLAYNNIEIAGLPCHRLRRTYSRRCGSGPLLHAPCTLRTCTRSLSALGPSIPQPACAEEGCCPEWGVPTPEQPVAP